ncbi:MAG: PepSY domain-containing protein [Burkholderiales bacterium]
MKRWLFLVHRWLGVLLCAFMAMWFFSGVVMMYVGYPKLTDGERLSALPALRAEAVRIDAAEAVRAASASARPGTAAPEPRSIRLTSVAGRPFYVVAFGRDTVVAVEASDGRRLGSVDREAALAAARSFAADPIPDPTAGPPAYLGTVREDAWTHSRALDAHRPLHVVEVAGGTLLYVSSATGEVVRDATRTERTWNGVGAWIHWLYPFRGGALGAWWHGLVGWPSVAASVLTLAGLVVGILRWRFMGRFRSGGRSPYRESWMKWHHWTGLAFGVLSLTWIFSGLMSMNPWKVFASPGAPRESTMVAPGVLGDAVAASIGRFAATGHVARELEWRAFDGRTLLVAFDGAGRTRLMREDHEPFERLSFDELAAAAARAMPQARPVASTVVERYDLWHYARAPHTMLGHIDRRLPILRIEFDDPGRTWLQMDPHTGAVVSRLDTTQRTKRWLFAMLHSWDWWPLLERRPLWDVLMVVGSLGGFALSVSGVVIGWLRLRRKAKTLSPAGRTARTRQGAAA